ncbi:MAG: GTP 3',8-cyclase MoaA [Desulfovibrio sp.]|nr:GTP 3',8-cyclase MoaA [Desulfovibrio sp.]
MADVLLDSSQRCINYMRLSLTDRCNFRCVFCMPPEGMPFIPHKKILRYAEILRLVQIFSSLGICHYKVTGGEPFCRKDIQLFIRDLTKIPGVKEVTITSNGSLAEPYLQDLAQCGISSITFSFPSFVPSVFQRVTRSAFNPEIVLHAMDRAAALGMRVKTNTVPLMGFNEADIVPIARYALERGFTARFIELMPVGVGKHCVALPQKVIRSTLEKTFGPLIPVEQKMGNGPAKVYGIAGYPGYVGFIAAMTDKFCATCNRVRLTSSGFFKTCLHHDKGVDLKGPIDSGADDALLKRLVRQAIRDKPSNHNFSFASSASKSCQSSPSMNAIGG